jgi:hypothetical protein
VGIIWEFIEYYPFFSIFLLLAIIGVILQTIESFRFKKNMVEILPTIFGVFIFILLRLGISQFTGEGFVVVQKEDNEIWAFTKTYPFFCLFIISSILSVGFSTMNSVKTKNWKGVRSSLTIPIIIIPLLIFGRFVVVPFIFNDSSKGEIYDGGGDSIYHSEPENEDNQGLIWIDGYDRSDGTHVDGHYRTTPDGDPTNNLSYPK